MAIKHSPLSITLRQYVDNPTGKGSAYVAARSRIKRALNSEFINLLQKYRRQFLAVPFLLDNGDIMFHVKVPSSAYNENRIAYDVLFLLKDDSTQRYATRNIQLYSNSPSFIFTYCYVYNQKDLIIDILKSRLPIKALTLPPEVRNPIESMGFEKSTYIAARYLIDGGCLTDSYIARFGRKFTPAEEVSLLRRIADPEVLVKVHQNAVYKRAKDHRKIKSKAQLKKEERMKRNLIAINKVNYKTGSVLKKLPRSKITASKIIKKNKIKR